MVEKQNQSVEHWDVVFKTSNQPGPWGVSLGANTSVVELKQFWTAGVEVGYVGYLPAENISTVQPLAQQHHCEQDAYPLRSKAWVPKQPHSPGQLMKIDVPSSKTNLQHQHFLFSWATKSCEVKVKIRGLI